jgi:hypothetical protein
MQMNMIIKSFDNEIVGARINKMNWAVVDVSSSPISLLTSDRPVEMARLNGPDGVVSIPISPTKLFVAVDDPGALDRFRARKPKEIVALANAYWSAGPDISCGRATKPKLGSFKTACPSPWRPHLCCPASGNIQPTRRPDYRD